MARQMKRKVKLILLLMKCNKPVLWSILKYCMQLARKTIGSPEDIVDVYLKERRRKIEKKLPVVDCNNTYMQILFPPDGSHTELKNWDLTLLNVVLKDTAKLDGSISFYLKKTLQIRDDLRKLNSNEFTHTLFKESKRLLSKLRSKCYKKLKDETFAHKIEADAAAIQSGGRCDWNKDEILLEWINMEENTVKEILEKEQRHYDTIKLLLYGPSCEVMRALVTKMVRREPCRSLDSFLTENKDRIMKRIDSIDKSGRQTTILFPRRGKRTDISKWDVVLLRFILMNACYLEDDIADCIDDIRNVRNDLVHSESCKLTDCGYKSLYTKLTESLHRCLTFIDDKQLTKRIRQQIKDTDSGNNEKEDIKEWLKTIDENERKEIEYLEKSLRAQEEIRSELNELLKTHFSGQQNIRFDTNISKETEVEIVISNCPEEKESVISDHLIAVFNEVINNQKGERCVGENDLTNAVSEIVQKWKVNGWTVMRAVKGSVLLKVKCASFSKVCELYDTYKGEGSTLDVRNLQRAVRRRTEIDIRLRITMYDREMAVCMEETVKSLQQTVSKAETERIQGLNTSNNRHLSVKLMVTGYHGNVWSQQELTADITYQLAKIARSLKSTYNVNNLSVHPTQHLSENMVTQAEYLITEEDEYFLRASIMLLKGGRLMSKEILYKELQKAGGNLDVLLKLHKGKFKHKFEKKQFEKLFPDVGVTDVETWDLAMLTKVSLVVFKQSLNEDEKNGLLFIKDIRDEIYAHTYSSSLRADQYEEIRKGLQNALSSLSNGLSKKLKDECFKIIQECTTCPISPSLKAELSTMIEATEPFMQAVMNKLRTKNEFLCEMKKELMDKLNKISVTEDRREKIEKVINNQLTMSGAKTESKDIDFMEEITTAVINKAIKKGRIEIENDFPRIRSVVDKILEDIESMPDVEILPAERKCILLKFRCTTCIGLLNILEYFESRSFLDSLDDLALALSSTFPNVRGQFRLDATVTPECMKDLLLELRAKKYGHTTRLPIKVESVQSIEHKWSMFETDGAANRLSELTEAVFDDFNTKITITPIVNLEQVQATIKEGEKSAEVSPEAVEDNASSPQGHQSKSVDEVFLNMEGDEKDYLSEDTVPLPPRLDVQTEVKATPGEKQADSLENTDQLPTVVGQATEIPLHNSGEETSIDNSFEISQPHKYWMFNVLLLEISMKITKYEFKHMKSLQLGEMGTGVVEKCKEPIDLFNVMRNRCYFGPAYVLNLQRMLWHINRHDLMQLVAKYAEAAKDVIYIYAASKEPGEKMYRIYASDLYRKALENGIGEEILDKLKIR